jgi:hypothetical protein
MPLAGYARHPGSQADRRLGVGMRRCLGWVAEPDVVRPHTVEHALGVVGVLMAEPGQEGLRPRQFRARHLLPDAEVDLAGFGPTQNFGERLVNGCSEPRRIGDRTGQVVDAQDLRQR